MRRSLIVCAIIATSAALYTSDAAACGGCFHQPPPPNEPESVITDHRMIVAVSTTESTLYDQIHFQGSPAEFAWVLPITGTVDVGLSADSVFTALDQLTAVTVQAPPTNCPAVPSCGKGGPIAASAGGGATDVSNGGVTVVKTQVVGPYETVQLHPTTNTDVAPLEDWLTQHGFDIPDDVKPVIAEYVKENFNFLALRLQPGQGVQSMRPVRVTTQGANVALPLRMIAAGTGATVGVELWVVSTGRYQPANFESFVIQNSDLTWDWPSSSSNYQALRTQKEAATPNSWEVESAITTMGQAIVNQAQQVSRQNAPSSGSTGVSTANDYLDAPVDGGAGESASQVQTDDYNALLSGLSPTTSVRITRMRADLAHTALNVDLTLAAASDQTDLSPTRTPLNTSGQPVCPIASPCGGGSDPAGSSATDGGSGAGTDSGCATPSSSKKSTPVALGLAFLAIAVGRSLRKRRRSS